MIPAFRLMAIFGLALACAAPAPVAAARQDPSPPAAASPEADGVAQIVTAAELAAWGRARRDPEALAVAARMLDEVPLRAGAGGDPDVAPVLTSSGLRQEAAALRGEQTAAEEIVVTGARSPTPAERDRAEREALEWAERERAERERAQRQPSRPAPAAPPPPMVGVQSSPFGQGPVSTVRRLASRENWSFEIDARGAEILRIAAIGDGDTNVDLTVRDASGKLLCADGFGDHYPVCTLSPAAPARLRVDVVNRGALWTRVQVLSN